MSYTLKISSPTLMRWLTDEAKNEKIILLDLEPDLKGERELHLDFNVVIKSYRIKRRNIGIYADYFVGCTSVLISFGASEGKIKKYSSEQKLDVNYKNSVTRKRVSDFKLIPEVDIKTHGTEAKAKIAEVGLQAEDEITYDATYNGQERVLTPLNMGNKLEWEIIMPRGEKVISDFFTGNLYLFVDSQWESLPAKGNISIKAANISFFDSERRPTSLLKSLAMEIALWKKGISMRDTDIEINFTFDKKI